jgi:hypothetical protein
LIGISSNRSGQFWIDEADSPTSFLEATDLACLTKVLDIGIVVLPTGI